MGELPSSPAGPVGLQMSPLLVLARQLGRDAWLWAHAWRRRGGPALLLWAVEGCAPLKRYLRCSSPPGMAFIGCTRHLQCGT